MGLIQLALRASTAGQALVAAACLTMAEAHFIGAGEAEWLGKL